MYADRRDVRDKEIRVRFSELELRQLDEAAELSHEQRAALMRELILEGARAILEQVRRAAAEKHNRNAA